jgi:hypothetical protein
MSTRPLIAIMLESDDGLQTNTPGNSKSAGAIGVPVPSAICLREKLAKMDWEVIRVNQRL